MPEAGIPASSMAFFGISLVSEHITCAVQTLGTL